METLLICARFLSTASQLNAELSFFPPFPFPPSTPSLGPAAKTDPGRFFHLASITAQNKTGDELSTQSFAKFRRHVRRRCRFATQTISLRRWDQSFCFSVNKWQAARSMVISDSRLSANYGKYNEVAERVVTQKCNEKMKACIELGEKAFMLGWSWAIRAIRVGGYQGTCRLSGGFILDDDYWRFYIFPFIHPLFS